MLSLGGINFLSPELLALIFEAFLDGVSGIVDAQVIIACSHVSQLWRNISLAMPHLWRAINLRHGSAEELVSWSLPLPLQIKLVGPLDE